MNRPMTFTIETPQLCFDLCLDVLDISTPEDLMDEIVHKMLSETETGAELTEEEAAEAEQAMRTSDDLIEQVERCFVDESLVYPLENDGHVTIGYWGDSPASWDSVSSDITKDFPTDADDIRTERDGAEFGVNSEAEYIVVGGEWTSTEDWTDEELSAARR